MTLKRQAEMSACCKNLAIMASNTNPTIPGDILTLNIPEFLISSSLYLEKFDTVYNSFIYFDTKLIINDIAKFEQNSSIYVV